MTYPDIQPDTPLSTPPGDGPGPRPGSAVFGRTALVRWENEGGSVSASPEAPPTDERGDLARMQARLNADFSNGLVGQHYNTYEHRARLVRQLRTRAADEQGRTASRSASTGR